MQIQYSWTCPRHASVGIRIGNLKADRPKPLDHPKQLSHDDCVRVFEQAITHPGVKWELVFGVSDSDTASILE